VTKIVAAAVQAAPVFLDRDATVEKVVMLAKEAAGNGAELIAFPETFVPTYPDWVWRTRPWADGEWYARLFEQSVEVPSTATETMAKAARRSRAYLVIGVNERDRGTIYNTVLYFAPDGTLMGKHRKLMPTGGERLVWRQGDGSTLSVFDTPFGRLGGLTCWENYMPLARYALYAQGIDVYVAPTWDNSDMWVPTMRHIAKEGRIHVIGVTFCLRGSDVPADLPGRDDLYARDDEWLAKGNSCIVGPDGALLAGPLEESVGIIYAEIDVEAARRARREFDPVGHYGRPDVFRLLVDTQEKPAAALRDGFDESPSGAEPTPGT
jgi:nitrilase